MANEARKTTDHDEIRAAIEARDGEPATVVGTMKAGEVGVLRVLFGEDDSGDSVKPISWEYFFEKFEREQLALLYREESGSGQASRFFQFVNRN